VVGSVSRHGRLADWSYDRPAHVGGEEADQHAAPAQPCDRSDRRLVGVLMRAVIALCGDSLLGLRQCVGVLRFGSAEGTRLIALSDCPQWSVLGRQGPYEPFGGREKLPDSRKRR
jgi:hypothetical protein